MQTRVGVVALFACACVAGFGCSSNSTGDHPAGSAGAVANAGASSAGAAGVQGGAGGSLAAPTAGSAGQDSAGGTNSAGTSGASSAGASAGGSGGAAAPAGGAGGSMAIAGGAGAATGGASSATTRLFPQANSSSSYAISGASALWSWGKNDSGQLGHAGTTPMVAALGMNAGGYAGGEIHAIAVAADGTAYTFGTNFSGQLGIMTGTGVFTAHMMPELVGLPTGVKALPIAAAGERYSAVVADDGNVYIWGGNLFGQQANQTNIGSMTANPTVHAVPKPAGVTRWKWLGGGYSQLLAIAQDDQLWAWGDNRQGQLGTGTAGATPDGMLKPVMKPSGVTGWSQSLGGRDFSLALASDGTLYAWGANDMGQLAAAGAAKATPTAIALPSGATGWNKVAAGKDHAAAITREGKLYTWGNGSGATLKAVAPPSGVTSWLDVSAGVGLIIGLGGDGKIYQWNTGSMPGAAMAGVP